MSLARENFSQSRGSDATAAIRSSIGTFMGDLRAREANAERAKQLDIANKIADAELLLRRQAENRQQAIFNRKLQNQSDADARKKAVQSLYDMDNAKSSNLGAVDAKYDLFNEGTGANDTVAPEGIAYTKQQDKDLDAMNKAITADYEKYGDKLFNDPITHKQKAREKLMATRQFTPAEATALAVQETNRRFPVASPEQIAAAKKDRMELLKIQTKGKGGSGLSVNSDGTLTFGGVDKTVTTKAADVKLVDDTIKDLQVKGDLSGWFGEKLAGNRKATPNRLNKVVTKARLAGADGAAIAAALRASVKDNTFFDDSIDITDDKFVKLAKSMMTKSSRTTTKGSAGTVGYSGKSTDDYIQDYIKDIRAIENSGRQGRVSQSDMSFFNPPKSSKTDEPKTGGSTSVFKPGILNTALSKKDDNAVFDLIKSGGYEDAFDNASAKDQERAKKVLKSDKYQGLLASLEAPKQDTSVNTIEEQEVVPYRRNDGSVGYKPKEVKVLEDSGVGPDIDNTLLTRGTASNSPLDALMLSLGLSPNKEEPKRTSTSKYDNINSKELNAYMDRYKGSYNTQDFIDDVTTRYNTYIKNGEVQKAKILKAEADRRIAMQQLVDKTQSRLDN